MTITVNPRHLERAAATYAHLRGLLLLPLAVLFGAAALANAGVLPEWAFLVALAACGAASWAIVRHYRAHYGSVRQSEDGRRRDLVAMAVTFATVVVASSVLALLPVNAFAVAFGLAMLAAYAITPGLRTHHVAVWGALVVAGAVPVWGDDAWGAGMAMAGAAVAVNGLLDHRAFTRAFGAPVDARP